MIKEFDLNTETITAYLERLQGMEAATLKAKEFKDTPSAVMMAQCMALWEQTGWIFLICIIIIIMLIRQILSSKNPNISTKSETLAALSMLQPKN